MRGSKPPIVAEYLLYLVLPRERRDVVPGDLEEEYLTIIGPKFGVRLAQLWYWKQASGSTAPFIWSGCLIVARRFAALSGVSAFLEIIRRLS